MLACADSSSPVTWKDCVPPPEALIKVEFPWQARQPDFAMPTPGSVGGFHAMYRFAVVTFYSVPNDRAVSAGLVLHAISFVPVTLLGIVFMAREGLSLGRVRSLAKQAGAEHEEA